MTCRGLVASILEFLEGDLDASRRRSFLRHLAGCSDCARYMESYRTAVALERESLGGEEDGATDIPEDLVRSIVSARNLARVRSISSARGPASHLWNLAAGIAASQVLFFYFGS